MFRKPCPKWVQISARTDNDATDHVTVMTSEITLKQQGHV